jgi:hypothetical protein
MIQAESNRGILARPSSTANDNRGPCDHTLQYAAAGALKQIADTRANIAVVVISRIVARQYKRHSCRVPNYASSPFLKATFG